MLRATTTAGGASTCSRRLGMKAAPSSRAFFTVGLVAPSLSPLPPSAPSSSQCPLFLSTIHKRKSSSASSSQWKARQQSDPLAQKAKTQGLKSRAAFKLLELNQKYRLFKRNQVVVDLGYAPGSWSQVAVELTGPRGLVVGIDLIPAQPPRGVTSIQGDFLSPQVRTLVKHVLRDQWRRRRRAGAAESVPAEEEEEEEAEAEELTGEEEAAEEKAAEEKAAEEKAAEEEAEVEALTKEEGEEGREGVDDVLPPAASAGEENNGGAAEKKKKEAARGKVKKDKDKKAEEQADEIMGDRPSYIDMSHDIEEASTVEKDQKLVDIVLSDMSEPWPQTSGFTRNTLSKPYRRLMNTSGMPFRDHVGSMALCHAALRFASDTLRAGGHLVCKFYQGNEDKHLEAKLRRIFTHIYRQKPEASRTASKEMFFVALGRKPKVSYADIEREYGEFDG